MRGRPPIIYNAFTKRHDFLEMDFSFSESTSRGRKIIKTGTKRSEDAEALEEVEQAKRRRITGKCGPPAPETAATASSSTPRKLSIKAGEDKPKADKGKTKDAAKWTALKKLRTFLLSVTTEANNVLGLVQSDDVLWKRLNAPSLVQPLIAAKTKVDAVKTMGDFWKLFVHEANFMAITKKQCTPAAIGDAHSKMDEVQAWCASLEKEFGRLKGLHNAMAMQ